MILGKVGTYILKLAQRKDLWIHYYGQRKREQYWLKQLDIGRPEIATDTQDRYSTWAKMNDIAAANRANQNRQDQHNSQWRHAQRHEVYETLML